MAYLQYDQVLTFLYFITRLDQNFPNVCCESGGHFCGILGTVCKLALLLLVLNNICHKDLRFEVWRLPACPPASCPDNHLSFGGTSVGHLT